MDADFHDRPYAGVRRGGQGSSFVDHIGLEQRGRKVRHGKGFFDMGALALAMFIGLFGFGEQIFGWNDGDGNIRLAIVAAFVFGIIMGWKTKN
jgi:hypothetical protein